MGWLKRNNKNFVFEFGSLSNLPLLQRVEAGINSHDTVEEVVNEAEDALELATGEHPNRPSLQIRIYA